jgi:hypothetical protein
VRASGYTALGGFRQHSAWNHWCFPFKRPNNVADISKRGQVAALAEAAGRLRRLEAFQAALEPIIGAGDGGYTRPYLTRCWPAPARDPWLTPASPGASSMASPPRSCCAAAGAAKRKLYRVGPNSGPTLGI